MRADRAHDHAEPEHERQQREVDRARDVAQRRRADGARARAAPRAAGQAGSIPSGADATKPASVAASTTSGARGSGGSAAGRRPAGAATARTAKKRRSATHSIASATAHGSAISAAKCAKDTLGGAERQQVREVGHRQEQRSASWRGACTRRVRARAAAARGAAAAKRRRGEQHDGRVEAEHGGDRGGRGEHERQQPPRRCRRAPTAIRAASASNRPGAVAAVAEHEQPGEQRQRRPERLRLVRASSQPIAADRDEQHAAPPSATSASGARAVADDRGGERGDQRGDGEQRDYQRASWRSITPQPARSSPAAGQRAGERPERLLVVGRDDDAGARGARASPPR